MSPAAQLALDRRRSHTAVVLLLTLATCLIVYKTLPALRAIRSAEATGGLALRPYLANSAAHMTPALLWTESLTYLGIIWPALVLGVLIAAVARMAIPEIWFVLKPTTSGLRATLFGTAAGMPLMLCSCCAAPLFEGIYGRTRRLEPSLALMLAAPTLNPAALALTFILFPIAVTAVRLALTVIAIVGVAAIAAMVAGPGKALLAPRRSELESEPVLADYAYSILHVSVRTVPLVLLGVPIAILMFHRLQWISLLSTSTSWMLILLIGAVLLLPLRTLFEVPLAYGLMTIGAPLGVVAAMLFVGPAVNLPSLLVVARAAGLRTSLLLALLVGGLAVSATRILPGR